MDNVERKNLFKEIKDISNQLQSIADHSTDFNTSDKLEEVIELIDEINFKIMNNRNA